MANTIHKVLTQIKLKQQVKRILDGKLGQSDLLSLLLWVRNMDAFEVCDFYELLIAEGNDRIAREKYVDSKTANYFLVKAWSYMDDKISVPYYDYELSLEMQKPEVRRIHSLKCRYGVLPQQEPGWIMSALISLKKSLSKYRST